jgi:nitric oxide dioxygenase
MLKPGTVETVKATAPAVEDQSEQVTQRFYELMFAGNPQVRGYFNQAHQHRGAQQRALAMAIVDYAGNIDNLEALGPGVELIAQKHCSLMIQPEHYPIVGKYLLEAIKDVLGDAATDEIIDAWADAYGLLASVMTAREAEIYAEQTARPGGWNGYRTFVVDRKVPESEIITSFYLKPANGGQLPIFKPGQYITVKIDHPRTPTSPRNYSLSDRPGLDYFRISVKREPGAPPGLISNYLHDEVNEGGQLLIGPPCGQFALDTEKLDGRPIVLLSGGVGLTPALSMLITLADRAGSEPVFFIHGARNGRTHAFTDEVRNIARGADNITVHISYDEPLPEDLENNRCDAEGIPDVTLLEQLVPLEQAEFYFCGPKPFLLGINHGLLDRGVPEERLHFEFFGPKEDLSWPPAGRAPS